MAGKRISLIRSQGWAWVRGHDITESDRHLQGVARISEEVEGSRNIFRDLGEPQADLNRAKALNAAWVVAASLC